MRIAKRRRRECKTDYLKRLKLLKGGKPRLVFRKTNKYFIVQYVVSSHAQDTIEMTYSSKVLLKHGWPEKAQGSLKSVAAAYLTGIFVGKQIQKAKKATPIIDFGMIKTLHKTKLFGFLKGLMDSGLEVQCGEECFPEESRIKGEHLKNKIDFEGIKQRIEDSLRSPSTSIRTKPKVEKI
jgi:large subunit ribosomal protein L18